MGRPLRGELEAGSKEAASEELRTKGVYAMNLEEATDAPMKTVLEHRAEPDPRFVPPDVEAEIEKVVKEADAEARAGDRLGKALPLTEPSGCCGMTELQSEVLRAQAIAYEIRDVLKGQGCIDAYADEFARAAMKEMIAEAAVRRFTQHCR